MAMTSQNTTSVMTLPSQAAGVFGSSLGTILVVRRTIGFSCARSRASAARGS